MTVDLERYIRNRLKKKEILLMTHTVLGYPSLSDSLRIIESMVKAGADLMELQIPFSEPIADGPVIARANRQALRQGVGVEYCLDVAEEAAGSFDIPFLFMTYYHIPFSYGVDKFVAAMARKGLYGAIIPDLPAEEGHDYLEAMERYHLSPIQIFSPTTSNERMKAMSALARGFIYCVARKGVTGADTAFSHDVSLYLGRCRKASGLPLAVGFGIKDREDVEFLKGKADIAVIGSRTIRLMEEKGIESVGGFIRGLGFYRDT
jgi:tryptophan synthase alpha chain